MKKITTSELTWHNGKPGSTLHVDYSTETPGGWAGVYRVETHGKDDAEIKAELDKIHVHHMAKEVRMNAFGTLVKSTLVVRGKKWFFSDCTITERGENAVELYVNVWDSGHVNAPGFPKRFFYGTPADIPDNAGIEQMVMLALFAVSDAAVDAQAVLSKVHANVPGIVKGGGV